MSIKVKVSARVDGVLTWFDITDELVGRGARLPNDVSIAGVYPDDLVASSDEPMFYDLLGAINDHADTRLRDNFFDGRVHGIQIEDPRRGTFNARIILETRYGSRNA